MSTASKKTTGLTETKMMMAKDSRHMGFGDLRLLRMYTILMVILWIQYPL
jgi:hypothetical protein